MKRKPYTVKHDRIGSPYQWIVVDLKGEPALWRTEPKVGRVPQRFRTQALAQAAADRLNEKEGSK